MLNRAYVVHACAHTRERKEEREGIQVVLHAFSHTQINSCLADSVYAHIVYDLLDAIGSVFVALLR